MFRILGSAAAVATALALAAPAAAVADTQTDYSINLSKSSATLVEGGIATNHLTFTVIPRLEDTRVTLSVTGLPSGVTSRFLPATPFLDGSSSLFLTAPAPAPVGTYTVTINALTRNSNPEAASASFTLTVLGG
ncbi:hypothetical protein [Actinoplanes sp. L3-i22]|uniref:hypothetical protein n=1 Tax=Actinoplanes sp. L3-i22 TaxID=2836373 RepID=UPI001C7491EB|nr:hypothetical protein [Actinoplanes sp. L3-i22]BCY07083.1 hypothetical protein L3i22_021710 [Actinoplanes sp. L3-i22]